MTGPRPGVAEHVREATRSLAAALEAVSGDPLTALRHAVDARDEADALVRTLAAHARLWHGDRGASWTDIGQALGVSKQAAQQRYGPAADQLLHRTIRDSYARQDELTDGASSHHGDARQPALTPGVISRRDDRYLLACDLIDGWTLWQLDDTDEGDDQALAVDPDRDDTDHAGAQEWATTVLRQHGVDVTGWATVPGRLDHSTPGWSPVVACRPPVEVPAPGFTRGDTPAACRGWRVRGGRLSSLAVDRPYQPTADGP